MILVFPLIFANRLIAIDAHAECIHVVWDPSTLSISVLDNGKGINSNDLELIGRPNHTSKISKLDDLVTSFGFRGNFLAEVARQSLLTITSSTRASVQSVVSTYKARIYRGRTILAPMVVSNLGQDSNLINGIKFTTSVQVRSLFSDIPVRHKHIQGQASLYIRHITCALKELALACPFLHRLSLSTVNGNQRLLFQAKVQLPRLDLRQPHQLLVLDAIYGADEVSNVQPFLREKVPISIHGFTYRRSNWNRQKDVILLLNGQSVRKFRNLGGLVKLISTDCPCVLNIEFPKTALDMATEYATSKYLSEVERMLSELRASLAEITALPVDEQSNINTLGTTLRERGASVGIFQDKVGEQNIPTALSSQGPREHLVELEKQLTKSPENLAFESIPSLNSHATGAGRNAISKYFTKSLALSSLDFLDFRVISQIENKFILIRSKKALILIDQHAADERIRLEASMEHFFEHGPDPHSVSQNYCISFSLYQRELLQDANANLKNLGISLKWNEEQNQATVLTVPRILEPKLKNHDYIKSVIISVTETTENNGPSASQPISWSQKARTCPKPIIHLFKTAACRGSITFGDTLSLQECEKLISKLAKCRYPFQCAHGRPSAVPIARFGELPIE